MDFLKRHKKGFVTAVTIFCLFLMTITTMYQINPSMIGGALGTVISPVQWVFTKSGSWISGRFSFLFNMSDLDAENARLKDENDRLAGENVRLKVMENENENLRGLLEIKETYGELPMMAADIISTEPSPWYNIYFINKGKKDGIKKNMIVLAAGGLAGRVTEVMYTQSKVVSIIDDDSSVSSKCERTDDTGFVRGDEFLMKEGKCRMELISAEAEIMVGDNIVTGQISVTGQQASVYPKGILIGTVVEITTDANGTAKSAVVKPVVSFRNLETVLVVTEIFGQELTETEPPSEPPSEESENSNE